MTGTPPKSRKPSTAAQGARDAVAGRAKPKKKSEPAFVAAAALSPRPASRVAEARRAYRVVKEKARAGAEATVFDRMGRLLDQPLRSESDLVRAVDAGLPAAAFAQLTRSLDIDHGLIAPESTLRRRVQDNMRFTTDESERMVRIARVHALAVDLFGDEAAAQTWLNAPGAYVPGAAAVSPYKLSVTDSGARLVEELLLRTAHGMF